MKPLTAIESFGGIDADADNLLDDCFQDHEAYLSALHHQRTLIVGRKGSGKTAIFRKLIRTKQHDFFSYGHTFSDYPWNHHHLQSVIGVPEEARYVQSWQYLILLTAAKILLNQDNSQPWSDESASELDRIGRFVIDSYGTRDPDVTQLFTPAKRLRLSPHIKMAKGWAEAGLDLERLPVSELPKIVQEVNRNVTEAIVKSLNPDFHYFICFDELDRGFNPTDPSYGQMLTGLILAAKTLNDKAREIGRKFSVVVFLRDDIYDILRFEDKNKITENYSSTIAWDVDGGKWFLRNLMERRFTTLLSSDGIGTRWEHVFNEEQQMSGRQSKYQHIIDRTFRRPRDIIKFCNESLSAYKKRNPTDANAFENADLITARQSYSNYLLNELHDEIYKHIPDYEKYLEILKVVGKQQFNRSEFEDVARVNLVRGGGVEALKGLFDFSIVGYQKTGGVGGGSEYVWRYKERGAKFDEGSVNYRVHPGLVEAFGLKKFTIKRAGGGEEIVWVDSEDVWGKYVDG